MGTCPECGTEQSEDDPSLGEIVTCPGCGADLEVIALDPPVYELYEQEEK